MSPHEALKDKTRVELRLTTGTVELGALQHWQRRLWKKNDKATPEWAAHFGMWFALANPKAFGDWVEAMWRYSRAEDMEQTAVIRSRLAALYPARQRKANKPKKA